MHITQCQQKTNYEDGNTIISRSQAMFRHNMWGSVCSDQRWKPLVLLCTRLAKIRIQ